MRIRYLIAVLLALCGVSAIHGQNVALKTNLLSDAALSPNLGIEVEMAPKWSLDLSGQFNLWTVDSRKWRHWLAQPELRYWFCRRFSGHFLGMHLIGGEYNFARLDLPDFLGNKMRRLKDSRYQGWGAGAGITYGFAWPVHPHWNIEAELGVGWIYTRFDSYPCAECGTKIDSNRVHNYVGPTKAAVNLVYLFK